MENYKKYTATQVEWEFKVEEMEFSCEELTVGDEVEFFNYYIDNEGIQNPAKISLVRCTKLKKTPFDNEWINYIFNTFYPKIKLQENITWQDLKLKQRLMFLERLNQDFINRIMLKIRKHYEQKEEITKN